MTGVFKCLCVYIHAYVCFGGRKSEVEALDKSTSYVIDLKTEVTL